MTAKVQVRNAVRMAAARTGVLEPTQRVRMALAPAWERRKRRDHAVLGPLMAGVLDHDSLCVDAGAHRGAVLELMVQFAPDARHVAFEPIPELADDLRNRYPGVDVHQAALADTVGSVTFQYFPEHADSSGIVPLAHLSDATPIEVPTTTLDHTIDDAGHVRFLKVDVEGAVLAVLRGGRATLARSRPVVVFEHTLAAVLNGTSSSELHDEFTSIGLRVFSFDGRGPLSRGAFERLVTLERHENFIARP